MVGFPGWLVSHFLSFPKQFTVRGSQCFKEWSPWCWMVWSGSRPACLPLPFICLPVLFICLPGWVLVVGFPAGLSPTSFHLSPRLGACGRVPGRLVSHFLFFSFVSHFFSFVSQAGCLWSRLACLPPSFHSRCLWSGSRPLPFICLPGWVLVVGFPAGLSPTSFHLSPTSFLLVVGFPAGLSPTSSYVCRKTSFHLSPTSFHLSPRLGACSRVSGRLVVTPNFFPEQFAVKMCPPFVSLLVSAICWCPPFSAAHVAFLFVRLPGRSLLVSALFRWPCNISIHLSTFLFICLPGLSLAVSALFR